MSSRIWPILGFSCALLLQSTAAAQEVHFDLPDYAELGDLGIAVQAGYEELDEAVSDVAATINYAGLVARTVSDAGDITGITSGLTILATFYSTLTTIRDAGSAESIAGLASSLTTLDMSSQQAAIQRIINGLMALNEQTAEAIEVPTLNLYRAVTVSCRARAEVEQLLAEARSGRDSLLRALDHIVSLTATLQQYRPRLVEAERVAGELAAEINDLLPAPPFDLILYHLMVDLVAAQAVIHSLSNGPIPQTLRELEAAELRVEARIGELDELIPALETALSYQAIGSDWVTSAETGEANALYQLTFEGRQFSHECTEIEGRFELGKLHLHNFVTPAAGGFSLDARVTFSVQRTAIDPVLGPQVTGSSVSMPMHYTATENNDDPIASSDYFTIPELGINLHIREEATLPITVWGQYDSPLRVVAVELADGADGAGHIETFAYPLTVLHGDGAGTYQPGDRIPVHASVPAYFQFAGWSGDSQYLDDAFARDTIVTMPARPLEIRALLAHQPIGRSLVVNGGVGGGVYDDGAEVRIVAEVPDGMSFSAWTGTTEALANPLASPTFARMRQDVVVTATWTPIDHCPDNDAKTTPGLCGCGASDEDFDGDGIANCLDACRASDFSALVDMSPCGLTLQNRLSPRGCTIQDDLENTLLLLPEATERARSIESLIKIWEAEGLISPDEATSLQACSEALAARSLATEAAPADTPEARALPEPEIFPAQPACGCSPLGAGLTMGLGVVSWRRKRSAAG